MLRAADDENLLLLAGDAAIAAQMRRDGFAQAAHSQTVRHNP